MSITLGDSSKSIKFLMCFFSGITVQIETGPRIRMGFHTSQLMKAFAQVYFQNISEHFLYNC